MSGTMLVTGGSRGIGAAICRLAAERGYDICVNYAGNHAAAQEVVAAVQVLGRKAVAVQADLARPEEIAPLFEAAAELGPLTALVNNAGITGRIGRLDAVDPEIIRKTVDLNLTGAVLAAREAVLRMSTRHGGGGGGIVNISSVASALGSPGEYTWYAGTKGAIDSFTIGLAKEVAGEGIRVNAVAPGIIETEIHAAGGNPDRIAQTAPSVPLGRAGTPQEIAQAVLWLLSEEASYVTGAVLRAAGGR
ncbi:MAG: SDR family oxidoreductase [Rhodovibrionaceae bacterium]